MSIAKVEIFELLFMIATCNHRRIAYRGLGHGVIQFLQRVCIADIESAGMAIAFLFVRLSVTFRCFVQTNGDTIMRSSLSGSTVILVSAEVKIIRKFAGNHLQRGR